MISSVMKHSSVEKVDTSKIQSNITLKTSFKNILTLRTISSYIPGILIVPPRTAWDKLTVTSL